MKIVFESYEDYTECPYRRIIKEIQLDHLHPDVIKEKCVSPWKCYNKGCPANNLKIIRIVEKNKDAEI